MDLMEKIAAVMDQKQYSKIRRNSDTIVPAIRSKRERKSFLNERRKDSLANRVDHYNSTIAKSRKSSADLLANKYRAAKKNVSQSITDPRSSYDDIIEAARGGANRVDSTKASKLKAEAKLGRKYLSKVDGVVGKVAKRTALAGVGVLAAGALGKKVYDSMHKKASELPSHIGHDGSVFYSGKDHEGNRPDPKTSVEVGDHADHAKAIFHHHDMLEKEPEHSAHHAGRAMAHYWAAKHVEGSYDEQ